MVEIKSSHSGFRQSGDGVADLRGELRRAADPGDLIRRMNDLIARHDLRELLFERRHDLRTAIW